LDFSATAPNGSLVTFTIDLPAPVTSYYKLEAGTWSLFPWDGETGAQMSGNTVTVTVRDNGRGDSNATPGIVTDPGAPAIVDPTNESSTTSTTIDPGNSSTTTTSVGPGNSSTTVPSGATTTTVPSGATTTTVPGGATTTTVPGGNATTTTSVGAGGGPATTLVGGTPTTRPQIGGNLPATGSSPWPNLLLALLIVSAGTALVLTGRRRTQ